MKSLDEILHDFAQEYSSADYLYSEENGVKPNLNWRAKNASKAILELIRAKMPRKRVDTELGDECCFTDEQWSFDKGVNKAIAEMEKALGEL